MNYARRLHDYSGTEREEASALIREINNIAQFQHHGHGGGGGGGGIGGGHAHK